MEDKKWIKNTEHGMVRYQCDNCKGFKTLASNFCPDCGAKMDVIKTSKNEELREERLEKGILSDRETFGLELLTGIMQDLCNFRNVFGTIENCLIYILKTCDYPQLKLFDLEIKLDQEGNLRINDYSFDVFVEEKRDELRRSENNE